jgi:replicative DNA helicase
VGWQIRSGDHCCASCHGEDCFCFVNGKKLALDFEQPVGVFSLEMSNVQLVNRLIVNVCQIKGESIKSGRLSEDEWVTAR